MDPKLLRKLFNKVITQVQRSKKLEAYQYYQGKYLVSCDEMGLFNSQKIHCENCCDKEHPNGSTSYYHKILCASIVHPDIKQDLQLAPEPIVKQDGATKNDCERNAGKRRIVISFVL